MYILFDCFGTVFNMENVPKEDLVYYGSVLRNPIWEPLNFPDTWKHIPAHPDSREGLEIIKKKHKIIALSNAPKPLMTELSLNAGIEWSHIIGLERYKIYKPNPLAYLTACAELDCRPSECIMISANKTFGDIEHSREVGMQSILIRDEKVADIIALAGVL
jgi:2-haloalkanoic acid dehalogenase type II